MENLIEIKLYSQELEKDITCKILITYLDYNKNEFIIKKFLLDNKVYFEFKEQPYINLSPDYELNNKLLKRYTTGKIIENIVNDTNINIINYDCNMLHQSTLIQYEFYILDKKYRNNTELLSSSFHEFSRDRYNYFKKEIYLSFNDKHRIIQPPIFNILKEIYSAIYYYYGEDFFGYFEKNDLEQIRLKKEMDNF